MSPGDVRTFKRGEGNAVVLGIGLWAKRRGKWIDIHVTGPDHSQTTVTNNPDSIRYHPNLFMKLRRTLVNQTCWPFGEEGAEIAESTAAPDQPVSRFNPIPIRGEPLSSTIIRDRGER